MKSARRLCLILKERGNSRQIFVKVSNIKFQEDLSNGSRPNASGQTDRHPD
jgi:hypothetical protein